MAGYGEAMWYLLLTCILGTMLPPIVRKARLVARG